jgi:MFS family permease
MREISRERLVAGAILALAILGAVAVYAPSLRAPFVGDDYIYLTASRDMPLGDFLRAAFVRGADLGRLQIARDYWRPLSFVTFRGLYSVFGGSVVGYHLFSLGIHVAGIVMVWLLARRLSGRIVAVAISTLIFAVHPAGVESITWISAINSAALPFALAGWLAFTYAVKATTTAPRWRWHALALLLIGIGLSFRETSAVILPALVFWHLFVPSPARLRERRNYQPLMPYAILAVVYLVVSTNFFRADGGRLISIDTDDFSRIWFYIKQALVPAQPATRNAVWFVQEALALVVVATPLVALAARRWRLFALSLAFSTALLPYGAFWLGIGARYFYFPSAFFALALGEAVSELIPTLRRFHIPRAALTTGAAAVGVALIGFMVLGNHRVNDWVRDNPDQQQQWVDDLRQRYPELPNNGTIYATNVPSMMALFGGYILEPTVAYYYPEGNHPVKMFERNDLESVRHSVGPNDRLFVFGEK